MISPIVGPAAGPELPWIYGATLGIRREAFLRLGGFDESLRSAEDIDLSIRAHRLGLSMGFVPGALVHCRLPHRTLDLVRQGVRYGEGGALLDRKWRPHVDDDGSPARDVVFDRSSLPRFVASPVGQLVTAATRAEGRTAWFLVGRRLGYLRGWLGHRGFRGRPSPR